MESIRCHYDGKVFVPDEPIDAPAGTPAQAHLIDRINGEPDRRGTMADLLAVDARGWIDELCNEDTPDYAQDLRRRASSPSYHKQLLGWVSRYILSTLSTFARSRDWSPFSPKNADAHHRRDFSGTRMPKFAAMST